MVIFASPLCWNGDLSRDLHSPLWPLTVKYSRQSHHDFTHRQFEAEIRCLPAIQSSWQGWLYLTLEMGREVELSRAQRSLVSEMCCTKLASAKIYLCSNRKRGEFWLALTIWLWSHFNSPQTAMVCAFACFCSVQPLIEGLQLLHLIMDFPNVCASFLLLQFPLIWTTIIPKSFYLLFCSSFTLYIFSVELCMRTSGTTILNFILCLYFHKKKHKWALLDVIQRIS